MHECPFRPCTSKRLEAIFLFFFFRVIRVCSLQRVIIFLCKCSLRGYSLLQFDNSSFAEKIHLLRKRSIFCRKAICSRDLRGWSSYMYTKVLCSFMLNVRQSWRRRLVPQHSLKLSFCRKDPSFADKIHLLRASRHFIASLHLFFIQLTLSLYVWWFTIICRSDATQ